MTETVLEMAGVRVLLAPPAARALSTERDATDLIGDALGAGAAWVAVPAAAFDPQVFDLSSRRLGEFAQKFVNYRVGLAILGDISADLDRSGALRDFVRESNQGRHLWFLEDQAALSERLGG